MCGPTAYCTVAESDPLPRTLLSDIGGIEVSKVEDASRKEKKQGSSDEHPLGFENPSLHDLRHRVEPNPVNVIIADHSKLALDGMGALIGEWEEFNLVGKALDTETLLKLCRGTSAPVVILGTRMDGSPLDETIASIKKSDPESRVIVIADAGEAGLVLDALRAGAQGYSLREELYADRLRGLLWGVVGDEVMLSGMSTHLQEVLSNTPANDSSLDEESPAIASLTARERQILLLLMDGLSNAEIGQQLYLSEPTVKKNISHIIDKLQVSNRVQAAVYAARHLSH